MRIVFIGTGEIGVPTLRALLNSEHEVVAVVTQPDKPVGREQRIEPPPIKKALTGRARPPGVPIFQPAKIKDPQAIEELRALKPDVIVVVAYGQILPRDVLEIPRLACLNVHASLLPRWRGAAPIQAAIAAGDSETGITVMYMDEGLDTGDILLKREIKISESETGGSLHDKLGEAAPAALRDALMLLQSGNAPRIPQPESGVTHAPKLERDAGRIIWSETADVIERKIRAFNPWPGTFSTLAGAAGESRKLKIHSATLTESEVAPGSVTMGSAGQVIVGTARGGVRLQEVQLEGKRRMTAEEFLRGTKVASIG